MIDDRSPYRKLPIENGRRGRRNAGLLEIDDDITVHLVGVSGTVTKADDVKLHRSQQFEPRFGRYPHLEIARERAGTRNHRAQPLGAERLEREPGLERAKAARQIGTKIARP